MATMALLLAGSWIFYRERMLLCDDAHIAFHIINNGALQIQQMRFGAFITQWVPLVLAKLHLPLATVLMGYSLSFNLFYFMVAALLVFRFRAYKLAILMAFYYTLVASDTFYWTNNEIHQGIAWMFLCFGYIFAPGKQRPFVAVLLVLLIIGGLAVVTHPLVILPFVFLPVFLRLDSREWPFTPRRTLILAGVTLLLFATRVLISRQGAEYDKQLLNNITAPSWPMAVEILKNMVKNYWLLPVVFIAGLLAICRQRKWLLVAWTGIFCIGYFIAVCMAFKGYLAFYTESELMPAVIFAATPFVYFILPQMQQRQVVLSLCFIFLVRLSYIGVSSQKFSRRADAITKVLRRMERDNISKLVLTKPGDAADPLWMLDWGLPAESFLSSALSGDTVQRQFLIFTKAEAPGRTPGDKAEIIMTGNYISAGSLNAFYFRADTAQSYFTKPYNEYVR